MTRKRKKSKESPGADKNESKRSTKMAQQGGKNGADVNNGMSTQNQTQTYTNQQGSNVYYNVPQYQNVPNMNYNPQIPMTPTTPAYHTQSMPSPPPTQMIQNSDPFTIIMKRLESMEKKLSQLDTIQASVNTLSSNFQSLDRKINLVETKLNDLENSRAFDSSMLDDINKRQKDLESLVQKMKSEEKDRRIIENNLRAEIQDLQCRSMRDNLMFYKLPEEKDENCEDKILSFIEDKLHIENAKQDIKFHRAHRIGSYNPSKVRPIVAKFVLYQDRERVRRAAKQLEGTPYGISEQFPKDVMDKRRKLVPIMRQARKDGKEAFIRVDKLFIDKVLYCEDK